MCEIKERGGRKFKLLPIERDKQPCICNAWTSGPWKAQININGDVQDLQHEQNEYKSFKDDLIIPSTFRM